MSYSGRPPATRPFLSGLSRLLLITLLCWSNLVSAATQGAAGTTSTGSVDLTLVTGLNVRISGFSDMNLGVYSGSGDLTANDNLCVGRTGVGLFGTGIYRILAQGDGEPGNPSAFTLTNGANQISYDAYFNDQPGTVNRSQLTPGVALTAQSGFGFWQVLNYLFGCSVENANISIRVPQSELQAAAGVYSGTLTVVLIPE